VRVGSVGRIVGRGVPGVRASRVSVGDAQPTANNNTNKQAANALMTNALCRGPCPPQEASTGYGFYHWSISGYTNAHARLRDFATLTRRASHT